MFFHFKDGVRGKSRVGREAVYEDALAAHVGQLLTKLEATGLSAQFGKTLGGIQSPILKIKPNN